MSDEKESSAATQQEKTPLERMKELTRRIIRVPKSEAEKVKKVKRRVP